MRTGVLVLPHRRYSMPETVMRKYRLRQRVEDTDSSSERQRAVDRGSQTSPGFEPWRSYPSLATPSPRAHSSSDCQTVSDKTVSTQDSTLSVPSSNSDRVPSVGEHVQTQVSLPLRQDKNTSTFAFRQEYKRNFVELAVNVEADLSDDDTVIETSKQEEEYVQVKSRIHEDPGRSVSCQADNSHNFPIPLIIKDNTDSQVNVNRTKDESSQCGTEDLLLDVDPPGSRIPNVPPEIACSGTNYDEYPVEKPVVPRYSAVPRTNSMRVNTSSVEFSSDSELSLTDSLEDPEEFRAYRWRDHSRHDERLVRGEVAVELERRRLPKSRDAYAYFLSLTGEEDAIREYSVPDWLRERLRRREEEIKKLYEDKFSRHQQYGYFRRRKKVIKRVKQRTPYSSSDKIRKNETIMPDNKPKNEKTVHFDTYGNNNVSNNDVTPSTSDKCAVRLINGNNMGVETKINNIHRNNHLQNDIHTNSNGNHNNNNPNHNNTNNHTNGNNSSHLLINSETANRNISDTNLLHISEIIKIEMSENSTAVITKEKQINMPVESNIKEKCNEIIKNELSNSTKIFSSKTDPSNVSAELVETNILNSSREVFVHPLKGDEPKFCEPKCKKEPFKQSERKVQETISEGTESRISEEGSSNRDKFKSLSNTIIQDSGREISLDRKIADILINALEENTKAHKLCGSTIKDRTVSKSETTIESLSKTYVHQKSQITEEGPHSNKSISVSIQTDKMSDTESNHSEEKKFSNKSCITEPYLVSVMMQTFDKNNTTNVLEEDSSLCDYSGVVEDDGNTQQEEATLQLESNTDENEKMVDKACNTVELASISTQTYESILRSEDILNGFKKSKTPRKKDVQFPPQVIKQIITGTGEYKTIDHAGGKTRENERGKSEGGKKVKVSKGTNTEEDSGAESSKSKNNNELVSNKGRPTPFCKNSFPNKSQQKKTQVLELNVPTCSCHMCTLQKISPGGDTSKYSVTQFKKSDNFKDEKKIASKNSSRRNNTMSAKFQMFEVIPEEKTSSNDSATEDQRERATDGVKTKEKAILTETHLVDQVVQVGSHIASVATNTDPLARRYTDLQEERDAPLGSWTESRQEGATQTDSKSEGVTQTDSKREEITEMENTKEKVTQTDSKRESVTQTDSKKEEVTQTETKQEDFTRTYKKREWATQVDSTQELVVQKSSKQEEVTEMENRIEEATQTNNKRERVTQTDSKREGITQTDFKQEDISQSYSKRAWETQVDSKKEEVTHRDSEQEEVTQTDRRRREGTKVEGRRDKVSRRSQQVESKPSVSHRKSSNLVIGRFRSDSKESPMLVSQYKGRASLSAGHLEGQEELVTLSKGWINFYLLKDNFDLSDSNEEPPSVWRRREQDVEEYTLEIHATPEPQRPGLLPNLRQSGVQTSGSGLPEIGRSSPGGSPPLEEQEKWRRQVGPLPGVRKRRLEVKREGVVKERQADLQPSLTSRALEVAEQSISSIASSTVIMSESPPPQLHKLPERKSSQRRLPRSLHLNNGSNWTVTVAGSNGSGNEPPPDVEMKLIFGKQDRKQEENQIQSQVPRSKRQGQMIEEFSHVLTNEKHTVQCVQDLSLHTQQAKNFLEKNRLGTVRDNYCYDEDYINRLSSRRSRYSTEDGIEMAADLHVTGLAITPEKKPRVPTQSERDILRPQRYKFTR